MSENVLNIMKKICKSFFIVIICFFGVKFIYDNKPLFSSLQALTFMEVGVCIGLMLFNFFLTASTDKLLMKALGVNLSWFMILMVTFINAFLNCVMPFGSACLIKAKYLKDKSGLSYAKFISLTIGVTFINYFVILYTAMASLLFADVGRGRKLFAEFVLILFIFACMAVGYLLIQGNRMIIHKLPFKKYIMRIIDGLKELSRHRQEVIICTILFIAGTLITSSRFMLILLFMGEQVSFVDAVFCQCAYQISSLITILPGNIGVNEFLVGAASYFLDSGFALGVGAVMVNRVLYYMFCFAAGTVSWLSIEINASCIRKRGK